MTRFSRVVLVALFVFPSCAGIQKEYIYQQKKEWVVLRPPPPGHPDLTPFQHPYSIAAEDLTEILRSIYYRENIVVSLAWGKSWPVFSTRQRELLSSALSQALIRAGPRDVAAFAVRDERHTHRQTKGFCFITGGELHLVIEELNHPAYLGEEKAYQPKRVRWRLSPQEGQRLYPVRPGGKGRQDNWLVIGLSKGDQR